MMTGSAGGGLAELMDGNMNESHEKAYRNAKSGGNGPEGGRGLSGRDVRETFFWSHVDRSGDCWEWTGALDRVGYGQFLVTGKRTAAHRAAYALEHGETPSGVCVLHRCDNRRCVRPAHLFLGTHADNMRDVAQKERLAGQRFGPPTKKMLRERRANG